MTIGNTTNITPPRVSLIDERTGAVSREWYRWFYSLYNILGTGTGIIPVTSGGTGLGTIPTNGQLLIGNGTGYSLNTLGTGVGISVTNGLGTITVANTGVLTNIAGTGISVSGATGNVTISNTGVLSWSGGTTGLTPATATTGAVTLAGTLAIANGGTNGAATPTAYGVAYGTGTAYAFTAAGTAKQVLIANTSAAPTWSTLTSGASILYGDGSGGFSNVTIGSGVSFVAGTLSATGSGGTVTAVTGSGNIASSGGTTPNITFTGTLPIANGGTNNTATPTAGAVAYGTGTAYGFTAAGTAGQVLTSAGAGVPTWTTNAGGDVTGPASSTDNAIARFDGTTGKLIQNSVTTIDDTGNASGILSQQFSNGAAVTLAAGKMWYDGSTGAWNLGMGNGNITQQVGEEIFVYGKASAAITDSPLQIIYHTGVVGASGVIQFAPTIAGITDVNAIIGIATEPLAHNDFGRATVFGVVRGITTNGTAFGDTWADDDVIWYNPVTGNPTKVEPVAPYIKVQVGLVIKAGAGGSGSFQVGIARGSKLGGTDSNVQFGTLANNNLIAYDSTLGYWKNVTASTLGLGTVTTVGFTGGLITVATATTTPALTVAGTSGGIVYFSSASTWASSAALTQYGVVYGGGAGAAPVATAAGTTGQVLTATTGGAPTWASPATSGTVTSVSVVSANGFAGTVATATTTPAITLTTTVTGLLKGNGTAISAAVANTDYVPLSTVITKTADYTITGTDTWIINNKTGSALTLTFPAASSWTGRYITVKNMQAQAVNSASSNIVPIDSTSAGTAILLGVVGNWATMVSDGTNWIIMQAASNNNLLLE
jgi:hypothetical protein